MNAMKDVDLSNAVLRLTPRFSGRPPLGQVTPSSPTTAWQAPLALEAVTAGTNPTAVVVIPGSVTRAMRPAVYTMQAVAPQIIGVAGNEIDVEIVCPVRRTDFDTLLHPVFVGSFTVPNAKLPAQFNVTHVAAGASGGELRNLPAYMDVAERLGYTYQWQPHSHFAAINSLPQEQGAAKQWLAVAAQRYQTFPAFRGFNYHDLIAPFKTWWDNVRKDYYDSIWDAAGKDAPISAAVPADKQEQYRRLLGQSRMLPSIYEGWNSAIKHAVPRLELSTMGWINANLTFFDPDKVAPLFDQVATQHMEEQFYHPVTVANQVDLWRTPGKPLWNYGNCIFQDDGTGAEMYRELMAGLMRGVQGIGRNFIPQHGTPRCEMVERCVAPAFGLFQAYGELSAVSQPDDGIAIWRSISQEALGSGSSSHEGAKYVQYCNTLAAYTACLYAHRPAGIVTDGKVLAGELKNYRVVIVNFEIEPTPDLAAKLKEFQDGGGLVLANKHLQRSWIPPGAVDLGPLFQDSHAYVNHNEDVDRWFDMEQEEGGRIAKALLAALGDRLKPIVDCGDPSMWISVLKHGDARYVFTTGVKLVPMRPEDLHRYSAYQNTAMPAISTLRFQPGDYVIYDVFDGKLAKPQNRNGQWLVECDMRLFPGRIFALLPKEIEGVRLSAGSAGGRLTLQAAVMDGQDRVINAACPLTVTLMLGDSRIGPLHRTARGGVWREMLPMPSDGKPHFWTVEVTELLGGNKITATVEVKADPPETAAPVAAAPGAAVEWYRIGDVRRIIEKGKAADALPAALIVEDKQREPLAEAIAAARKSLESAGCKFVEVSAKDYLADKPALGWDKFQFGQGFNPEIKLRQPKYSFITAFDTPALPSGVIPLASLPVRPTATDPGPGRGLLQFIAMPVYDGEDAISISGGDPAGVLAAVVADQPKQAADPGSQVEPRLSNVNTGTTDVPEPRPGEAQEPGQARGYAPTQVRGAKSREKLPGLSQYFGAPAAEVAVSPDGTRIAVGLKAWGNNVFVLNARNGKVLGKD
ncbi:MAG TPA: hypothetical protein VM223_28575, partial [Planctomycetota bacterium]|nr:hypothetical protein [Planctomycetota bacterium]